MIGYKDIKQIAKTAKAKVNDLLVLAAQNNPFYVGSPAQIEKAKWSAKVYEEMGYAIYMCSRSCVALQNCLNRGGKMGAKCFLVGLAVASLVVCFSAIGRAASDPDLIFYMSFNKASGDEVEDDSGNGNTGTLKGDAEIVKDGKFGSALSAGSAAGYVDCGNAEILNQEFPGLTIEAWIYPETVVGRQGIVMKFPYRIPRDHFGFGLDDKAVGIAVADGKVSERGFNAGTIEEKKWIHVAGTWNSKDNNHELYINGKLAGKGPQTGKGINLNSDKSLTIGGPEDPFNGSIDEVAIYSRVLTEDEIKRDMRGVFAVQASGKVSTTWADIKTQ